MENPSLSPAHLALLNFLTERGPASSAELQAALVKSQPTVSRLLRDLSAQVLTLGRGKRARYALPQAVRGMPARQALWWVSPEGQAERWGTLSFLSGLRVHVEAEGIDTIVQGSLPWFLTPLRAHGFLGRLLAERLSSFGLDANPERWSLEDMLFAAQGMHDAPGAVMLGEQSKTTAGATLLTDGLEDAYERLSRDVATGLPAGSSAGGEQAKFLAHLADDRHVLVKFSPPRGTPFGDRWTDLLHAEALALQVLEQAGFAVARSRVVTGPVRSFLESERFDRKPGGGRLHVVALDAVHDAFVHGPRQHWAASCEALADQRRLSSEDAERVRQLLFFGRLIGNTDMHFGNLGLWVDDLARGRFRLAPVYDMLPMRYRPDAGTGLLDLTPFEPDVLALGTVARTWAKGFWERVSADPSFSPDFRELARTMETRLAG